MKRTQRSGNESTRRGARQRRCARQACELHCVSVHSSPFSPQGSRPGAGAGPPWQSRPASLGQSALPSRGPPCTSGTSSRTALSSQFAPPTWVRPPTTFGGRAAASSHAWIARHQPCVQARLKLIKHESRPWRCQWMKVRMPTPLGHTSTMASIGESNLALHIARNPLPPFNHSTCRRADGSWSAQIASHGPLTACQSRLM